MHFKSQIIAWVLTLSAPLVHGIGLACERQTEGNIVDNTDCICAGSALVQNNVDCNGNVPINETNTLTYECGSCSVGVTRYNGHGTLDFNAQLLEAWFSLQAVACTTGGFQTNSLTGFFHKSSPKRDVHDSTLRWVERKRKRNALPETLNIRADSCPGGSSGGRPISVLNRYTLTALPGLLNDFGRSTRALVVDGYDTLTTSMWRAMQRAANSNAQQEAFINNVPGDRVTLTADLDPSAGSNWGEVIGRINLGDLYNAIKAAIADANEGLQRSMQYAVTVPSPDDPNTRITLFRLSWSAWQELAGNGPDVDDIIARLGADSD
ncbi:hypothetical protein NHQ30_005721 [Ciborinia camelliae]|nr:hypothetical protein NHQ30_005721 [Ciborinia camelliae]